jgi:hypothetical protein
MSAYCTSQKLRAISCPFAGLRSSVAGQAEIGIFRLLAAWEGSRWESRFPWRGRGMLAAASTVASTRARRRSRPAWMRLPPSSGPMWPALADASAGYPASAWPPGCCQRPRRSPALPIWCSPAMGRRSARPSLTSCSHLLACSASVTVRPGYARASRRRASTPAIRQPARRNRTAAGLLLREAAGYLGVPVRTFEKRWRDRGLPA